jgi:hypothetical protein
VLAAAERFIEMIASSVSYLSGVPGATRTLARVFAAIARQPRRLTTYLFDPYRPELHYMRGPARNPERTTRAALGLDQDWPGRNTVVGPPCVSDLSEIR